MSGTSILKYFDTLISFRLPISAVPLVRLYIESNESESTAFEEIAAESGQRELVRAVGTVLPPKGLQTDLSTPHAFLGSSTVVWFGNIVESGNSVELLIYRTLRL